MIQGQENKKIIITNIGHVEQAREYGMGMNSLIVVGDERMEAQDDYHTFGELYEHRHILYIKLCEQLTRFIDTPGMVWRSKVHYDGSAYEGWFILGINKEPGKQITYHIPDKYWSETEFAETLEKAPEWDKHTPTDVIERILRLL